MSSGERPIGAAKGKQPNTEASCQTPVLALVDGHYQRPDCETTSCCRLEMEAKAKAEQDRLHQIIKRQEEEIAQLQQMVCRVPQVLSERLSRVGCSLHA